MARSYRDVWRNNRVMQIGYGHSPTVYDNINHHVFNAAVHAGSMQMHIIVQCGNCLFRH